jgi:hypothetical protein
LAVPLHESEDDRGLGGFVAAIGSVSHAVLHEADRPVVVFPERAVPPAQQVA